MLTPAQKANITRKRNRMTPAQKAVATRRPRQELESQFGADTHDVVTRLAKGLSTEEIANDLYLWNSCVAAYAANFTRGTYDHILVNNAAVSF